MVHFMYGGPVEEEETAEEVAKQYKLIIPLERMDEGLVALFHHMYDVPLHALLYLHTVGHMHNKADDKKEWMPKANQKPASWDDEPEEVRKLKPLFEENNAEDYKLYAIANRKLDEVMNANPHLSDRVKTYRK